MIPADILMACYPTAAPSPATARVQALEAAMRASGEPAVALRVDHHFSAGVYVRVLHIPAGVLLAGCLHRTRHLLQVITGTVWLDNGDVRERVTGPAWLETQPGTKRAIYAETDALVQTIHVTDLTDVDAIGAAILEPEPTLPPPMLENAP